MQIEVGDYVIPYFTGTITGYEVLEVTKDSVTYLTNDGLKINEPISLIEEVLPF